MNDQPAICGLCGEPMPHGEEMFQYHGYSGPCPVKPPIEPASTEEAPGTGGVTESLKAACDLKDPLASLWPILRFCVLGIVAGVSMSLYYSHGFVIEKDGPALATILTALGGFDALKKWVTRGEL